MEQTFIEKLIKRLIVKQDYILVPNEEGRVIIDPSVNVLLKQDSQCITYIQIIDGDNSSIDIINERLEQKDGTLLRMGEQTRIFAYSLFVFSNGIDEEKLKLIEESQRNHETEPKAFKSFVVDTSSKEVKKLFNRPSTDRGLLKLITHVVEKDSAEAYDQVPIETLVLDKKKDYQITYQVKKPILTYGLIAINILVYLALVLYERTSGISYGQLIIQFGAKVNNLILEGEYWRLITPIFLHGSLMHLLVNCYSLYIIGSLVERLYGRGRFITSYLIAGILGNLCSFLFVPGPSVGASGAIFGLMGILLYFGLERPLQFKVYFGSSIITTILINLVYGFSSTGIDNFAHLGGLIGGFLAIGILSNVKKKRWYFNKLLYVLVLSVLTVGGIAYGFNNSESKIIRNMNTLDKLEDMEKWDEVEKIAKDILDMDSRYEDNQIIALWSLIRAQGIQGKYDEAIPYCNQLIALSPADGHYMLGIIYYDQGELQMAKEELSAAEAAGADAEQIQQLLSIIQQYENQ